MSDEKMIAEWYLKNVVVNNKSICLDLEQLFSTLYTMESYSSFVAITDAGISVIVC